MKKFLNIRNLLILFIIIIAIAYILLGRSTNVKDSKTCQLFKSFYNYDTPNSYSETMIQLKYKEGEIERTYMRATDYENKRELYSFGNVDTYPEIGKTNNKVVGIISENGLETYKIDYINQECLKLGILKEEASGFFASWVQDFLDEITKNHYYTRGYKLLNGELMYYEYFKGTNLKCYYNKNGELSYLSSESIDNSFEKKEDGNLYLYEAIISHDSIDNSLIAIPEGYKIINAGDATNLE